MAAGAGSTVVAGSAAGVASTVEAASTAGTGDNARLLTANED